MAKIYTYHNGRRRVGGTAALLHKVKQDGGLPSHYAKIFEEMAEVAIDKGILEMARPMLRMIVGGRHDRDRR